MDVLGNAYVKRSYVVETVTERNQRLNESKIASFYASWQHPMGDSSKLV
jgi:hypothetical protein